MRKKHILLAVIYFIGITGLFAQKNEGPLSNRRMAATVKADGDLKDWNDSLENYNAAAKLSYAIANDDANLYLAIKTTDPLQIRKILSFGFTFAVNNEGKKKPGVAITYPVVDQVALRTAMQKQAAGPRASAAEINRLILSKATGIKVEGFKEIIDGDLSLNNEYGVRAAASVDSASFKYELIIPLKLLNIPPDLKSPLAGNLKVNGLQRTVIQQGMPMGRYGYGRYGYGYGYGYGERESYKRTISESVDFWISYVLAPEE